MTAYAMDTRFYIYTLSDPTSREVYYVGKTSDPKRRLQEHIRGTDKHTDAIHSRNREVLASGKHPVLSVIEEVGEAEWETAERRWIKHFRDQGIAIVNHGDGGQGLIGENHPAALLSDDAVVAIRVARSQGALLKALALQYGVAFSTISLICNGQTWTHLEGPVLKRTNKKLTDDDVQEIRRLHSSGMKQIQIAKRFGLGKSTVCLIIKGQTRKQS